MTTPPDKLFRQGLEHYKKSAPGSAWERIESGLDRKRNRSPWMKIAAGLLIVIVTSVVVLQFNPIDSSIATVSKELAPVSSSERSVDPAKEQLAVSSQQSAVGSREASGVSREAIGRRESADVSREAIVQRESSGVRREAIVQRESSGVRREALNGNKAVIDNYTQESTSLQSTVYSPQSAVYNQQSSVYSPQSSVAIQTSVTPDESNQAVTTEQVEINIDPTLVTQVGNTNETSMTDATSDSKRSNIMYTAEEVNAKYLKKESTAEATPEKKNTSGLQKVIDLALDLKNEGSVLGNIREKKNEWLSINIPSNKRETNK